ncbi:MAG TPA: alpha/beta hydrolase fold domain-containing protein [Dongiaceae bacterium]|jgi:acetyl esterase|nr:alpha/beta hydrolase fold domain-containing protein [Dongiaceae bacterium]
MIKVDIVPRLDPEMAAALNQSRRLDTDLIAKRGGPIAPDDIAGQRAAYDHERAFWNEIKPAMAAVEPVEIPRSGGSVRCRLYRPGTGGRLPALVYLHGGGWVLGSLDTHDRIMRLLAEKSGVAVLGVDYRLAPEHKFPAAYDDALAALRHLLREGAGLGIDPARLAVGGDSAGANLALATCLQLDAHERAAVKIQLLYYGSFGLADSASRRAFGSETDGLTKADLDFFRDCLLRSPADAEDMRYDCLSADLRGLPPAFIAATDLDPLLDDSRALAELLEAAGVAHDLVVYEGVLHGFLHLSRMVSKSMRALDAGAAALRKALAL